MSGNLGQILPGSTFGNLLTSLAERSEIILEVGTWHGEGSTRCLASGLCRPEQQLWTVEQDLACYEEARSRHVDPRIRFVCGKTLEVIDVLPSNMDLLLLDGDDLSTYQEWQALAPRSRWVAMDDTNEQKNRTSRAESIQAGWKILADHPEDRNGWAVFERP